MAEASFEPLGRVQASVMDGLLAALAGSANTVRIWDWRRRIPHRRSAQPGRRADRALQLLGRHHLHRRRVGGGLGQSLTGGRRARGALSIVTQGWWPGTVAVGAGDYIGLGGRLYIATAAVAASGAGTATIAIAPPLRATVVVGDPLILSLPSVPMRLVSDDEAANPTRPGPFAAVTIRLEEAL